MNRAWHVRLGDFARLFADRAECRDAAPPRRALVREKTQETMEEIAIAELSTRQGKQLKRKELQVNSVRVGDDWQVTITPLPAKPGGFNTVILSQKGELKAIVGGE